MRTAGKNMRGISAERKGIRRSAAFFCAALFAACAFCFCAGCGDAGTPRTDGRENFAGFDAAFPVALGGNALNLRLALTDLERRQGLTGCRGLKENSGMIFVYPDEAPRAFWMRGVPADLSIGFFDAAGTLLETQEMRAQDLNTTRSRADNVKFALEMPPRWFEENGVSAGARLDLSALASAMRSRGFSPKNFAL